MRRILAAALGAVTLVVMAGASATAAAPLAWGVCPADDTGPGLQCSTLKVPLNYRDPGGRQIDLAISRLSSSKPAKRRGILLLNQGGPGLTGLKFSDDLVKAGLPQQVLDSYDVIGFDPRGVGHSTPLTCDMTPTQRDESTTPPYPYSARDVTAAARTARTVAKQCGASRTGAMLPFITTANTARDMDRIRAALGAPKLSYFGGSYGTYLGAVYTTLFPNRSDRIVLDSNLGPDGYDMTALRGQGYGFQTRFPDFAKVAAADPKQYGLGSTPAAVTAKYFQLAERLDKTPVQGYNGTDFRGLTAYFLRADSLLPLLGTAWHDFDTNQPLPPVIGAIGEGSGANDNFAASDLAVVCGESQWPSSVRTYQRDVAVDRARYPMYGASSADIRPCAFWPSPVQPKVRITDHGPSDVLMVQNLRDPATPLAGALRLRSAFGDRARMVTVDQGGHGVYLAGNKCANDAVTDYLVSGVRSTHDTFCPKVSPTT